MSFFIGLGIGIFVGPILWLILAEAYLKWIDRDIYFANRKSLRP